MRIAEGALIRAVGELQKEGKLASAEIVSAFGKLIRRRKLIRRVSKIGRALDAYAEADSGIVSVVATTAHPLTDPNRKQVTEKAAELLGQSGRGVSIEFREDPALIGGIRLETADSRYDSTVARAIKELRKSL